MTEEDTDDGNNWRWKMWRPLTGKPEEEEDDF